MGTGFGAGWILAGFGAVLLLLWNWLGFGWFLKLYFYWFGAGWVLAGFGAFITGWVGVGGCSGLQTSGGEDRLGS